MNRPGLLLITNLYILQYQTYPDVAEWRPAYWRPKHTLTSAVVIPRYFRIPVLRTSLCGSNSTAAARCSTLLRWRRYGPDLT